MEWGKVKKTQTSIKLKAKYPVNRGIVLALSKDNPSTCTVDGKIFRGFFCFLNSNLRASLYRRFYELMDNAAWLFH